MDTKVTTVSATDLDSPCEGCGLLAWAQSTQTTSLPAQIAKDINQAITHNHAILRGRYLVRAGTAFKSVFALHSGLLKNTVTTSGGLEQVTGFVLPGDPVGLDGLGNGTHICNTLAIEDSRVCAISFAELERLCHLVPAMQHHFHRILGKAIAEDCGLMLLLGSMNAGQRIAYFLLNLSARYAARKFSGTRFRLRMSRQEMGSYLGLKLETVSRMLTQFKREGLIALENREVEIKNVNGLRRRLDQ